jgi:hypothetical protein
MLGVIVLSVLILCVIMLSVLALFSKGIADTIDHCSSKFIERQVSSSSLFTLLVGCIDIEGVK